MNVFQYDFLELSFNRPIFRYSSHCDVLPDVRKANNNSMPTEIPCCFRKNEESIVVNKESSVIIGTQ